MREKLRRAEDGLAWLEGAALAALVGVMVVLAFAQVALRQFGQGLLWGETVLRHLVLWTGFLGAALAARDEKHFAWEAAHLGAPERLKPWLRLLSSLAAAAVCALLLEASWSYVQDAKQAGEHLMTLGSLEVPAWLAWAGIPGGFALVLLHLLFKSADALFELKA